MISLSLSLWGLVNSKSFIFSAYNEFMFHLLLSCLFTATRYRERNTQHQLLIEYRNHKSSSTGTAITAIKTSKTDNSSDWVASNRREFALIIRRVSRIRSISLCSNCHRYVCQKAAQCAAHLTRVEYQQLLPVTIPFLDNRSISVSPPPKTKNFSFHFSFRFGCVFWFFRLSFSRSARTISSAACGCPG